MCRVYIGCSEQGCPSLRWALMWCGVVWSGIDVCKGLEAGRCRYFLQIVCNASDGACFPSTGNDPQKGSGGPGHLSRHQVFPRDHYLRPSDSLAHNVRFMGLSQPPFVMDAACASACILRSKVIFAEWCLLLSSLLCAAVIEFPVIRS